MLDIDRQPLILTTGHGHNYHHYDENVAAREVFKSVHGEVRIVHHVNKGYRRPSVWQVGVILYALDSTHIWIGGTTTRGGHHAYLRNNPVTFELRYLQSAADALDALRWAIARLYP